MSTELLTTLFMLAVCILATVGATAIIKIIRSHPKKEPPDNIRFMSLPEHLQAHERVHRFYGAAGTYFDVVIRGGISDGCHYKRRENSALEERRPLLPDDIVKKILSAASERAAEKLLKNVTHKNSVTQLNLLSERVKRLETKHIPSSDYIGKKISDGLVAGLEKPSEKVEEAISKIAEKILTNSKNTQPIGLKDNHKQLPESRESELRRFVQNDLYSILHDTSENVVGCFYNSNGNGDGVITIALMNAPSATLDIHEATVTKLEIINRAVVVIDDTDF